MNRAAHLALLSALPLPLAAAPAAQDFAYGIPLAVEAGATSYELLLPDSVYRDIQRDDLGDLRVFNAAGEVVQHALCVVPNITQTTVARSRLPVFPLPPGVPPRQALGAKLLVKTPQGTRITVIDADSSKDRYSTELPPPAPTVQSFVLDARAINDPLQGLRLDWEVEDGRAEVAVRIEASDDLNQWREVVSSTTLLRSEANGQTLERALLPLPQARYHFLRIRPLDSDVVLELDAVEAEVAQTTVQSAPIVWVDAAPDPQPQKAANSFFFRSQHRAPMQLARVQLPADNMAVQLSISARAAADRPWRLRGQGESYALMEGGKRHLSEPLRISPEHDRLWRLQLTSGAESLGDREPGLALGYAPSRLWFLAQGSGPYLLAYGSARVKPSPQMDCKRLPTAKNEKPGAAEAGNVKSLGGGQPLPKEAKRPAPRLIILWTVLGVGALLIVLMAMNLLKRLRPPQ